MPTLIGRLGTWEVEHLHYWKDRGLLPSVRKPVPLITRRTPVATIGSCFAQNVAKVLDERGFTVGMHPSGVWYNTASMAQELEQLFGERSLADEPIWQLSNGAYVHPFKAYHRSFPTREALQAWSEGIDARARALFSQAAVVVVTLGLTEIWESTVTGHALIEIPPPDVHTQGTARFRPTGLVENRANLERMYQTLRRHTRAELIFTVSPVPLYATFRDLDVRVANTISKSTLRAALADLIADHPDVHYFHSFEIATALDHPRAMFEDDGRHVRDSGVELIMDEFLRAFGDPSIAPPPSDAAWINDRLTADAPVRPGLHGRVQRRLRRLLWGLGWRA